MAAVLLAAAALKGPLLEEWSIRRLKSPDPYERRAAAERLGELRSTRAIPALIDEAIRLDDKPFYGERFEPVIPIATAAANALVAIGPPAIPAILELFKNDDRKVLAVAAELLRELSPDGRALRRHVLAAIADLDAFGPREAAVAIVAIGVPAIPAVLAALEHEEPAVRRNGTRVLTSDLLYADSVIGALVVPALRRLLDDADSSVKEAAAEALESIEVGRIPIGTTRGEPTRR